MDHVLNQREIDAIVRLARGSETIIEAPSVTAWDIRRTGQIGSEQMRSLNLLHEGFARGLSHSLGAYLGTTFHAALVSAEQLSYREFLKNIPDQAYLTSCKLVPMGALALFQLDFAIAFPLIDLLLGGEGNSTMDPIEITEIEEQILEVAMRIVCRELQTTWQALSLEFEFERRQPQDQVQHLMPSEEKVLSLSFEITLVSCRGTLNLAVPGTVSNALIRKMSAPRIRVQARAPADSGVRLRDKLLRCSFPAELRITVAGVQVSQLLQLAPGDLLVSRQRVDLPATLAIHDHKIFSALVARQGAKRAAQLLELCPQVELGRKQT